MNWLTTVTRQGFESLEIFGTFFLALLLIMIVRAFVRRESWVWLIFGVLWATGLVVIDTNVCAPLTVRQLAFQRLQLHLHVVHLGTQ